VLNQTNCTTFDNNLTDEEKNVDQALTGVSAGKLCFADNSSCIQLVGLADPSVYTYGNGKQSIQYCFLESGVGNNFHLYYSDGSSQEIGTYPGSQYSICGAYPSDSQNVVGPTPSSPPLEITSYGCSVNNIPGCPASNVKPVTTISGDPLRQLQCKLTGSDGQTYTNLGPTFHESDKIIPPPVCETLPSGVTPTHEQVWLITVDGSSAPKLEYEMDPTPGYSSLKTMYPDCATGACQLQLYSVDPTAPCVVGGPCANWFTDTHKADDYKCYYGPASQSDEYLLDLTECNVLSNYYDLAKQGTGDAYGAPGTGADLGTKTSPDLDHQLSNKPAPVTDPDGSNSDCFPTGWAALNPLQWVLQPVQCAFQWAFIPPASTVTDAEEDLQTDVAESPPGKIAVFLGDFNWPAPATGCSGIDLDLSGWKAISPGMFPGWSGHVQLLDACPGTQLAPWATFVNVVLTLFFIGAGIVALSRLAGKTFGYTGLDGE
jgi:hypothetical protein